MSVLENFDQWKGFLGDKVQQAEASGMPKQKIEDVAFNIGGYLAKHVNSDNKQEQLLAEMWKVSNKDQQHAIAEIMVQLVSEQ